MKITFLKNTLEKKFAKPIKAFLVLAALCAAVFFSNEISAQIQNIYGNDNSDIAGINALMSAVANNDVNGVKFFSKAGSALINQKNIGGATSLHLACRQSNTEIAEILIKSGGDVNAKDNEGWTPLMRSALAGNPTIVKILMANNAEAGHLNSLGESAIIHSAISGCSACLNAIFEKVNLVRSMDIKILKEQLTDAFMIARNHEDEMTQGLLESYLDQVIKTAPLIERERQIVVEKEAIAAPDKIFRIIGDESGSIITKSKPQSYVYKPTKNENIEERVTFLIKDKSFNDTEKKQAVITKSGNIVFKFNPGPQAICNAKPIVSIAKPIVKKQKEATKIIPKKFEKKISSPDIISPAATTEIKPTPAVQTEIKTTTLIKPTTEAKKPQPKYVIGVLLQ